MTVEDSRRLALNMHYSQEQVLKTNGVETRSLCFMNGVCEYLFYLFTHRYFGEVLFGVKGRKIALKLIFKNGYINVVSTEDKNNFFVILYEDTS